MGLMAMVEMGLDPSKSDFLTLGFARRRRGGGQPPRSHRETPLSQPEPPENGGLRLTRRQVIIGIGGIVGAGSAAVLLKPWELFFPPDYKLKEDWLRLSSKERIKKLEFKQYPKFSDFDATSEMMRATVQYYCSMLGCSFENMLSKVSFVDTQRIIQEVEFDMERKLTDEERKRHGEETVEMFSIKRGLILISKDHLKREVDKFLAQPDSSKALGGSDPDAVMLKSVLFHAYTHANADRRGFPISPITIPSQIPITLDRLDEGFVFFGQRQDGRKVFLSGGNEAITDFISVAIGQETGLMMSSPLYTPGVRLVEMLNMRARIDLSEFMGYYFGQRPKRELFRRWGGIKNPLQPDEQAALATLITIALRVNHPQDITQEQTLAKINELLRP